MGAKTTGLFREMIIHPGETLKELIDDRGISQVELAHRTGVSEAFISDIIRGRKGISSSFARKLEYATGVETKFWSNLQADYDAEIAAYEEQNNISAAEIDITKILKQITNYLKKIKILPDMTTADDLVLWYRRWMGISDLANIPKLAIIKVLRRSDHAATDPYVLLVWLHLCKYLAEKAESSLVELSKDSLSDSIERIKNTMFLSASEMVHELEEIFADCGIIFQVVKHFPGAPVQGAVLRLPNGGFSLCLTIRGAGADIFWFSLMHEIGHIINGDVDRAKEFVDYLDANNDASEQKADDFAKDALMNSKAYADFISKAEFSPDAIRRFADTQGVLPCIVIGRMSKERILGYHQHQNLKRLYKWED